jgi:hypothetical protein
METTASFASSTIGWSTSSRSSMESPAATWRRRSTSFSKRAGSPRVFFKRSSMTVMFFTQLPKSALSANRSMIAG